MSPWYSRRILPVVALAAGLLMPQPGRAAAVRQRPPASGAVAEVTQSLWSWAGHVWRDLLQLEKNGAQPDPDGLVKDNGAQTDPDGLTRDNGAQTDPNG